jgi:Spy/CpxP family protein refolding chaperone
MRAVALALLVVVMWGGLATPAGAGEPAVRGPFEEAGRLVDQMADRLRSLGAELAQQIPGTPPGPLGRPAPGMGEWSGAPAERPLITIMLRHRSELGLTADQVGRLEALRGGFAREAIRREADIRIAELDLSSLLAADPVDLPTVEGKVRDLAQLRAELRIARLRAIEQGKAVLTPEQRTRLQAILAGGVPHGPGEMPQGPRGMAGPRRSADAGAWP